MICKTQLPFFFQTNNFIQASHLGYTTEQSKIIIKYTAVIFFYISKFMKTTAAINNYKHGCTESLAAKEQGD